ncbi:MAG: GlsB/YeaQ/YmgE family stress response membrane protein [Betaproteobacteria bacterium]
MLNLAVWLVVGAVIGLVAGLLMRNNDDQSVFVNVLVGVIGALAAGWFVAPYLGLHAGDPKVLDFRALSVSLVGAIASLALLSVLRRRKPD